MLKRKAIPKNNNDDTVEQKFGFIRQLFILLIVTVIYFTDNEPYQ